MIIKNNLILYNFNFPIFKSDNLIEKKYNEEIKNNWPYFDNYQTTTAGQTARNNIEIKLNNSNYLKIPNIFSKLYDELNSKDFRNFLKDKFINFNLKDIGFIGDFDTSELVFHIAESKDGYENPWHVDTRGRIIHFLIYFGDEDIKEGGELAIGQHKKLDFFLDYKQYPLKKDLEKIEYFKPKNNLGIFILSQNNSYHKGCFLKGKRRFIYGAFTNKNGPAWKTENWSMNKNFTERLKEEKLE